VLCHHAGRSWFAIVSCIDGRNAVTNCHGVCPWASTWCPDMPVPALSDMTESCSCHRVCSRDQFAGNTDLNHHGRDINSTVQSDKPVSVLHSLRMQLSLPASLLGPWYCCADSSIGSPLSLCTSAQSYGAGGAVATRQMHDVAPNSDITEFRSSRGSAVGPLSRARPIGPTGRWVW
jgi:hypothetical protein